MVSVRDKHAAGVDSNTSNPNLWFAKLRSERPELDTEVVRQACDLLSAKDISPAKELVQRGLEIANTVLEIGLDHDIVVAALVYPVAKENLVTSDEIQKNFGPVCASLVDGMMKMASIQVPSASKTEKNKRDKANTEALRKMLLAMVEDIRVVVLKLADRLFIMRRLNNLSVTEQQQCARETLDFFAPLANRLGIWQFKWELEDLSFRYLQPELYKKIAKYLNERRISREEYIQHFISVLRTALSEADINAEVTGRPKHIYSIYRKMQRKGLDYHQLHDVRATRILVPTVRDCYAALGITHSLWAHIPGEFDDYIATPKANNYQSLHTAVIGPEGKVVEVQIRTYDMHKSSELGVAAHWRYKEGTKYDTGLEKRIAWLRQLLEWKDEVGEAGDLFDKVKSAEEDHVYVFTPKGKVIDLPHGATPLDFAYHVHTDVGHRCRGAKVNGHMVPLTYTLKTGEQVEVLLAKTGTPSLDWLNPNLGYLRSPRARAKALHWFKQQNFEHNVAEGRAVLDKELDRLGFPDIGLEKLRDRFNFNKTDDFLAALGRGELKISHIVHALQHLEPSSAVTQTIPLQRASPTTKLADDIYIHGVGNLLTHLAHCCRPVPGDEIAGYITKGRGVAIHRQDCSNVFRYKIECSERLIEVAWGTHAEKAYPVDIQITAFDRPGLLRDITSVLANEKINVIAVNTLSSKKHHTAAMTLTIEISDLDKLSSALAKISQVPNITEVRRKVT